MALDSSGNIFIADSWNHRIRRVEASSGIITTVAGNGTQGFSGDGYAATNANLAVPSGVAVDAAGNLFIADTYNNRIRLVDAVSGTITTVAGNGTAGFGGDGGLATSASLDVPFGVAVDGSGNLFIADIGNQRIRRVDKTTGKITTVAGNGTAGFSGDGGPATSASLNLSIWNSGISLDSAGNLFIPDSGNERIRRVGAATGIITTVAGGGPWLPSLGDGGPAISASLGNPAGVAVDSLGHLFIADNSNNRIREVALSPGVSLSTTALTFADQFVGAASPWQTVTVTSTGGLALTITSIGASGDYVQTNTCPISPATLNPGSTCTISVSFTPTATGSRTGTVTITDNSNGVAGSTQTVGLSGTGVYASNTGPAVSLAPPSLSFPATSSSLVVTLTNSGVSALTISNIATSVNYTQTNTCPMSPATLASLANCSITVTFTPTVAGTDPGTLTITDNASDSPQSVSLAATFTTPQQPVSPGTSTTFNNATIMSETVLLPPDANMTGTGTVATAFKAVSFIPVTPAVFSSTRLPGTKQDPNWSGGSTPIPAGTTCTVIAGTGGNCIVIRDLCFDSNHKSITCDITAPTTPIQLTSHYETPSPASCPGYIIADDGQPNWAVITNEYYPSNTTIGGGTKTLNTDTAVVDLGAGNCASAFSGTTAPTTSAVTIPSMPNGANGWFTTSPVTVILASTGDALVKQISYSINGGAPLTVPGASTLLQITNQGVTTISYQATDEVGNVEALKTLVVKIDTTPPVVSVTGVTNGATYTLGAVPTAGCSTIDAISGVATAASLTLTGGVPPGVGSFTATCSGAVDMAGNRQAAPVTATYTVTPGPLASVSPSSINFGTVYLGTITTKNVTVTNQGDAPMTITDPILSIVSGGNSKEFVALNLCPKSLAAGKSCTIYVIFVAGPYYAPQTATLKVMDNAPGSPQTVVLSATVINPQAHLSATSLSFGTQKVGTSNAAKAVTLTNTGATALTITSIAIAGTNPLDFVQTNNCPSSLAANAGCTVYVTFKPTASGLRSASVVITDNAQNSPQNISLSGTGK